VRSTGAVDQVSARKFLEAAKSTGDPTTFFAVFRFFEQRNLRLKGSTTFSKGEQRNGTTLYTPELQLDCPVLLLLANRTLPPPP
jgi:hypothetical protein